MKVVFRADASVKIGTGHVMRCLTLADELARQGHQCVFIVRDHPGHLGELIVSKKHELHLLSCADGIAPMVDDNGGPHAEWLGVSWQHDASQVLKILAQIKADWLVVDHYALDARWERDMSSFVSRIMVIDDLADRDHQCDLILDQNLGRDVSHYNQRVPDGCIRLIGPRYAILRPEFSLLRERSLKRRQRFQLNRMLISLGGVDRNNVTGLVLAVLAELSLPREMEVDIVMGAASPHLDEVQKQVATLPFKATVGVNVRDMAERMYMADLSIGAAGGTSWERCCLGLPAVLVVLADNQVAGAMALEEAGAAAVIGGAESVPVNLPVLLQQLAEPGAMRRMSDCAAAVTPGDGVSLVAQALVGLRNGGA